MAVTVRGRVRQWREDKPGGLAGVDIPSDLVGDLGGRHQMRVTGSLNGADLTGSTMLVAGGGCASSRSPSPGPRRRRVDRFLRPQGDHLPA
jgi:uncharacterized protein DUF1905